MKNGKEYFRDADRDGYGDPSVSEIACIVPRGYVDNSDDCDDSRSRVRDGSTYWRDSDNDGLGDLNSPIKTCGDIPEGYS